MQTSGLSTGLMGVQRGLAALEKSAVQTQQVTLPSSTSSLAPTTTPNEPTHAVYERDLVKPLTDQLYAKNQVQASANVIRSSDQALGTLIDIMV